MISYIRGILPSASNDTPSRFAAAGKRPQAMLPGGIGLTLPALRDAGGPGKLPLSPSAPGQHISELLVC
jgi:hypothetical protein